MPSDILIDVELILTVLYIFFLFFFWFLSWLPFFDGEIK